MKLLPLLCLSAVALDETPGEIKHSSISVPSYTPARLQQSEFNEKNFKAEYYEQVSGENFESWLRAIQTSEHAAEKIFWLQTKPQNLRFNGIIQFNNVSLIGTIYPRPKIQNSPLGTLLERTLKKEGELNKIYH